MKPIEIAIEHGQKLREFDSLEKAQEFFFPLVDHYRNLLRKIFSGIFNVELQYSFEFLGHFDKTIATCLAQKNYESIGISSEEFDRCLGIYFGDLAERNRYGKWIVKEYGLVKGRYELGIVEANGYTYHMGLYLTSSDYIGKDGKPVALKVFTDRFHLPKKFIAKNLSPHLIDSINNFKDKRFSEAVAGKTVSDVEIDNFLQFDIMPFLGEIESFLSGEKKPVVRDEVYRYLQYYCWKTQNRHVCQFLIDRLKFEDSVTVRKDFFWSRLSMIDNLATYEISELVRIANDPTDKNYKNCRDLLKTNGINYSS